LKKLLFLGALFTFLFTLAACGNTTPECTDTQELVDGVCVDITVDTTAPEITGVADVTVYKDATFDPLSGVAATDDDDGDITADITISGTVDTTTPGIYYLCYICTDAAGNSSQ